MHLRPRFADVARTATSAAVLSAVVVATAGISAAATNDAPEPTALDAVGTALPAVLTQTSSDDHVVIEDDEIAVAAPEESQGVETQGVSFTIDYASDPQVVGDGIVELDGQNESVDAVVQATGFGVRVLTVIADADAPSSFDYTFDVPAGTSLVDHEAGSSLQHEDDLYGTLQDPWAVDQNGKPVPTTYAWRDGVLTQKVDLSDPTIAYPVVADPAWSYSYKFPVTKTPSANRGLLRSCFNCYFPVSGAPRKYPVPGQILPLRVVGVNFECRWKQEFTGTNYYGFQFDATKNHVDKLGSNIIFQFRTINGKRYLTTDSYIVNDAFWVKNAFYRSGAISSWQKFADNLNRAR